MVGVIFQKRWRNYSRGDRAGFPEDDAARLVGLSVATYAGAEAPRTTAPASPGVIKGPEHVERRLGFSVDEPKGNRRKG
jgi:hypothetical protein